MYNYNEMVQRIVANKQVLWHLKLFYSDDMEDYLFQEEIAEKCRLKGISEDKAYAMYFAARLPGEKCFEKIMMQIEEIETLRN